MPVRSVNSVALWAVAALFGAIAALHVAAVFTDAHLGARDFFWDAPHPTAGAVRQIGSPMRLSGNPPRRAGAGPSLGAHTREVLREAGLSHEAIDALVRERAAREEA